MNAGRIQELRDLNNYYEREGSQIVVMYGGCGVGKQSIIEGFVANKPFFYYRARPASEKEQLAQLRNELTFAGRANQEGNYGELLASLLSRSQIKKIFVIDDFHHIIKNSSSFMPNMIDLVHDRWKRGQVMVVLVSSQTGWVENTLISKLGDMAYEISGLLRIGELDFYEATEGCRHMAIGDRIEAYAILGGYPALWRHFDGRLDTEANICRNILARDSYLHDHAERTVTNELRESGIYSTLLSAVAGGHTSLAALYTHTGFSRAKISVYMKNLGELGLVARDGDYRIANHFVHFYFTYMYPHLSDLFRLSGPEYHEAHIAPTWRSFVAPYFTKVCAAKLRRMAEAGESPYGAVEEGRRGSDGGGIDITARDAEGRWLIALCNWQKPLLTYDDYEWLLFCAAKADIDVDVAYLFSGGRFDEKLTLEAKVRDNIRLLGIDKL